MCSVKLSGLVWKGTKYKGRSKVQKITTKKKREGGKRNRKEREIRTMTFCTVRPSCVQKRELQKKFSVVCSLTTKKPPSSVQHISQQFFASNKMVWT
jgi:hypothetical protein